MDTDYRTSDQGLAAYMMERGLYCAGTIPDETAPGRRFFIFVDVTDPRELEESYFRYKKEPLSARSYFEKMRAVRQLLRRGDDRG